MGAFDGLADGRGMVPTEVENQALPSRYMEIYDLETPSGSKEHTITSVQVLLARSELTSTNSTGANGLQRNWDNFKGLLREGVRQVRVESRKERYLEESQYVVRGLPSRFEVGGRCKGWGGETRRPMSQEHVPRDRLGEFRPALPSQSLEQNSEEHHGVRRGWYLGEVEGSGGSSKGAKRMLNVIQ